MYRRAACGASSLVDDRLLVALRDDVVTYGGEAHVIRMHVVTRSACLEGRASPGSGDYSGRELKPAPEVLPGRGSTGAWQSVCRAH